MTALTFWEAEALAKRAHEGQKDKLGEDYLEHVRAVALGVLQFGADHGMAALLHDVVEDTDLTLDILRAMYTPEEVVVAVALLTKEEGERNQDYLERISHNPMACRVKIADNAHNTLPERVEALAEIVDKATMERLDRKYRQAQQILWKALPRHEVAAILQTVNPSLLSRLEAL